MFGFDIVFAMIAAAVICRAISDETYCLVTGKESARQQRLKKRIEDGKPLLGDIATDWLNNVVNGGGSPSSDRGDATPAQKFRSNWWANFWDYWDQWWSDVWAEAKRRRREKHRKRVRSRIFDGRDDGNGGGSADSPPPNTPHEPDPVDPDPQETPAATDADGDDEEDVPPWDRHDWVPPPPILAQAVRIPQPQPAQPTPWVAPAALPPPPYRALPGPGVIEVTAPPEQNGNTTMTTFQTSSAVSVVAATNAMQRMGADDTDPEATIQLGKDLQKLVEWVSDVFDGKAEDLAALGVGGLTQLILCEIQDDFDNLIKLARRLSARGNAHADLADHVEQTGDVHAGQYLMRGRELRPLRKRPGAIRRSLTQ